MWRRRRALALGFALVGMLGACGSGQDTSTSSLLSPSQPLTIDPEVIVTSAGVDPQVLHVGSPATITFTNHDSVSHRFEVAPELRFQTCPELNQLPSLEPGQSASVRLPESVVICGYHDAATPANVFFQGLIVLH